MITSALKTTKRMSKIRASGDMVNDDMYYCLTFCNKKDISNEQGCM